jgi:uncharacterized circularly permuted ATP-grasp superfamily protein
MPGRTAISARCCAPARPEDAGIATLLRRLAALPAEAMRARARRAERELMDRGITFTVYSEAAAIDRILPLDLIPRVITAPEWDVVERGVKQRVAAHQRLPARRLPRCECVKDGVIPAERVFGNPAYRKEMQGWRVPLGTYSHVCGTDIVRDEAGRLPGAGGQCADAVGRLLRDREPAHDAAPALGPDARARPPAGRRIRAAAAQGADRDRAAARRGAAGRAALARHLQLGLFRHVFLAREMGVPLVEGRDLVVEDARVFMRTTAGLKPVHSIYRRSTTTS